MTEKIKIGVDRKTESIRKYNLLQLIYKLEVGGAERVVCSLAKELDKSKFNVGVASFKGGPLADELRKEGIPVFVIGKKWKFDVVFFLRLLRLLLKQRIDILHAHTFSPNFWGRIASIVARVPIIITTEHTVASYKKVWQRRIDKYLSNFSNAIIAVSNEVKKTLVSYCNIDPFKIVVIHNGINYNNQKTLTVEQLCILREHLKLKFGLPVILTIGRLSAPKGHIFLLEAISMLLKDNIKAQFLIAGDGPLRNQLEQRAKQLEIQEYVNFLGFRDDVETLLQLADIIMFPSIREGFSIALLEAMAAGKPIIATDVGGNKEAIQSGISGILVPPQDANALKEALLFMLRYKEIALNMGKAGEKRFQENFTISITLTKIQTLYQNLINRKNI
ncbi:MAG: glycosyltransferase [Candidatus Jordarchaeaceae archaeon]